MLQYVAVCCSVIWLLRDCRSVACAQSAYEIRSNASQSNKWVWQVSECRRPPISRTAAFYFCSICPGNRFDQKYLNCQNRYDKTCLNLVFAASEGALRFVEHTAAHCSTLQHNATQCSTLHHTATHCNTWCHKSPFHKQIFAKYLKVVLATLNGPLIFVLQCVAVCCSMLQCVAVCCSVLQ